MFIGIFVVCFTPRTPSKYLFLLRIYYHVLLVPECQRNLKPTMNGLVTSDSLPRSIAFGDFNQDNKLDIVVANSGTDNIDIFFEDDNGTFVNQTTYSTGSGSHPYSVAVSDFNNDNFLDIVVANYGTNSILLFLGKGNGTFSNQQHFQQVIHIHYSLLSETLIMIVNKILLLLIMVPTI